MKNKIILLIVLFSGIISCNERVKFNKITLGNSTFCIPKKYETLDQSKGSIFDIKNADVYNSSFQTAINPSEIKNAIPEYALMHGERPAVFFINTRFAQVTKSDTQKGNIHSINVLTLADNYENARIQYDEQNDFYRVSNWGGAPPFIVWEVLKIKPQKNVVISGSPNDYFVAACSSANGVGTITDIHSTCEFTIQIHDQLVKIVTTENNLKLKDKLINFSKKALVSWRKNCN